MREKIEKKIDEIIEFILSKDVSEITYSEYKILDYRSKDLKYQEEQVKKNEELGQLMVKTFSGLNTISAPPYLPEPEIKEEK